MNMQYGAKVSLSHVLQKRLRMQLLVVKLGLFYLYQLGIASVLAFDFD